MQITICHEGAGTEEIVSEAFQITLRVLTLPVMVNFGLPPVETLLPGPENAPDNCNLISLSIGSRCMHRKRM
jgi:hypothetical protein